MVEKAAQGRDNERPTPPRHASEEISLRSSSAQEGLWPILWPGLILIALGALGMTALHTMIDSSWGLSAFDIPLLEWFASHRVEPLVVVVTVITDIFSSTFLPFLVLLLSGLWWWRTRRWREPALVFAAMAVSTGLAAVLKEWVGRPRPPAESMSVPEAELSFSFPSGHTIGAATLVLSAGYLLWALGRTLTRLITWLAVSVGLIALVALTRLYLGYHFLTDVLGGTCLAIVVLGFLVIANRTWPTFGSGPRTGKNSSPRPEPR